MSKSDKRSGIRMRVLSDSVVAIGAAKDFPTANGQWLAIGLDVFNVANLLNSNWGAEYQLPVGISNQNPVV